MNPDLILYAGMALQLIVIIGVVWWAEGAVRK